MNKSSKADSHRKFLTFPLNEMEFLGHQAFIAPYYHHSLNDILKQGIVNEDWAREIAKDLCEGLSFMHSCSIAHRDIKPHNIMIDNKGRAKIIDFGLSGDP